MTTSQREPLERVTVNLIPRAARALDLACDITGDSKTDVINRALQVYAYVEHVMENGGDLLVREDGETSKIVFNYPPSGREVPASH